MRYELLVGLRYTRAKRRNHFISFISLISMAGIALGVAALIVVLSVMNGFQQELRSRILAVVSHVQLTGPGGWLTDWRKVAEAARSAPHVLAAAPYVNAQGMLSYAQGVHGAIVRGIDPKLEAGVADIGRHMRSGSLDALRPGEFHIVLGAELARSIGALRGDKVALIAPQGRVTPAGVIPRLKQFTLAGTFELGMFEYDANLALVNLEDAQKLYQLGNAVSGVRLKLDDLFEARSVARQLSAALAPDAYASDWTRSHANFFRAVEIEKRVMFIILTLIVAVAAFNIVSTLVMLVTDKQADIAILRTLGAAPSSDDADLRRAGRDDRRHRHADRRRRRACCLRSTSAPWCRRSSAWSASGSCRPTSTSSRSCPRTCSAPTWSRSGWCRSSCRSSRRCIPSWPRRARQPRGGAAL